MLNIDSEIDWQQVCWPASKLDQALEQMAAQTDLLSQTDVSAVDIPPPPPSITTLWISEAAKQLNFMVESVSVPYSEADEMISRASPALFRVTRPVTADEDFYLLILKGRRRLTVLCPDLSTRKLTPQQVRQAWCYEVEETALNGLVTLWDEWELSERAQATAGSSVAKTVLANTTMEGCWLFYAPPHTSLWRQMRQNRTLALFFVMLLMTILQQAAMVAGWAIIGQGSLNGRFDGAWLLAWVFMTFTGVLFQAIIFDIQGPLATSLLRFVKSRLLYGALQLESDEIRHQGSGQFFGRVLESDLVQNFLVGGALISLPFIVTLVSAGVVLWYGAGGGIHVMLLVVWAIGACYIGWRRFYHGVEGMRIYREMTNDLVENMIGHRTRLAQESRSRWHEAEDKALAQYTEISRFFDNNGVQIDVLVPRGWLVFGLLGIVYPFVTMAAGVEQLAISLGGILLANMAFESLAQAMKFFAQAVTSWQQISPLLAAANRISDQSAVANLLPNQQAPNSNTKQPVIMLRDITFSYSTRNQPVLQNCHLTIMEGDQLLLEGPSGGGKSTLAAVISGLRQPQSGLLLLWGFDPFTVGDGLWRQRVVTAPQFQENHVFTDSLAFNLLMGRSWPPSEGDLEDAEEICRQLGLGDLLDRMPDGLNQIIGDGEWQLSFGERSRLFIARALLQNADLVILDESFGALDPESLKRAMECVLQWTRTLLVIAHP